jgi:hypothetical protein
MDRRTGPNPPLAIIRRAPATCSTQFRWAMQRLPFDKPYPKPQSSQRRVRLVLTDPGYAAPRLVEANETVLSSTAGATSPSTIWRICQRSRLRSASSCGINTELVMNQPCSAVDQPGTLWAGRRDHLHPRQLHIVWCLGHVLVRLRLGSWDSHTGDFNLVADMGR